MPVYVYSQRLHNYSTIQWQKCVPGDDYCPGLLLRLCGPYLMEEHNYKRFKSLPRSLRIAYDFSDTLKIHLKFVELSFPETVAKWPHKLRLCSF